MNIYKYINSVISQHEKYVNVLKTVNWKNERAQSNNAYVPTTVEHIANIITHGVSICPSIYGSYILLQKSKTKPQTLAAIIYGLSLIFIFTISTVFHIVFYNGRNRTLKDLLHRVDRAMIYIFIAASYFPWLVLQPLPSNTWVGHLWWIIWVMAVLGIIYQQLFHERYKSLETCFYLIVGVGPSIIILQHKTGLAGGVKLGGLLYVLGVGFFKCDGTLPCAHAIWHLFVAVAAATHYMAILQHLYAN